VQDLLAVNDSRPPVPEDHAAREVRRLSVAQKKKKKDTMKKRQIGKALEREALYRRRRQQRLEGLPVEESPSEMASEEDEDSDDNDAESRYDTATFLTHLPDVRSLQGPIDGQHPSRGRKSQRKEGPERGLQKGDPLRLGSLRRCRWRRARTFDRPGPRWAGQRRQRLRPGRRRQA
jgi:hypothetical protein